MTEFEGGMHKYYRAARAFKALLSRHITICVRFHTKYPFFHLSMFFSGEVLRQVQSAGREDVDRAVESAREAFHEWSILSGFQRGQILKKAADIIRVRPI